MFDTPILILLFNRPDLTEQVFASVKKIQPKYLYVAADGPRSNKPDDIERCEATRSVVMQHVDWDCEIKTLFQEKNLGCGIAPAAGITWFFNHVEEGIILEDDTVANTSFFTFCNAMLEKYRDNKKIMHIGGDCFIPFTLNESYYFTNYTHVWGWATWKRAWKFFDFNMHSWKQKNKTSFLYKRLHNYKAQNYWRQKFDQMAESDVKDIWDYQWTYTCWANNGLSIAPSVNLVSNIGFRSDATHTHFQQSSIANMPTYNLDAESITHPSQIKINKQADGYVRDEVYLGSRLPLVKKVFNKLFKV